MKTSRNQASLHEDISREHEIERGSSRSVGLVFAVVFIIVALYPLLDDGSIRTWSVAVALVLVGVSIFRPKTLDPLSLLWFKFGMALHAIVSPVVLGLLFFGVITPIGLLMRLLGKDLLNLNLRPSAESYWIERSPPGPAAESMKHQF
tara:strand:+ start:1173 stop:1616 length:444 start_codon:yes stop_codon:yes gene_type:complete